VRQKYIDQVPMKRPCEYRDVSNVVVFLASDAAGYMTGQAINVTGGQENALTPLIRPEYRGCPPTWAFHKRRPPGHPLSISPMGFSNISR
jgi:hypothetical protein